MRLIFVKIFTLFFSFESSKFNSYSLKHLLSLNSFNLKSAKTRLASSGLLRYSVRNPANKGYFSCNLNSHRNEQPFSKIIKKSIFCFVLNLEIYFRVYFLLIGLRVFFLGGGRERGLGYFSISQYLSRYSYYLQELNVRLKLKEMRPSLCQVP